jgi:hypothetical protein
MITKGIIYATGDKFVNYPKQSIHMQTEKVGFSISNSLPPGRLIFVFGKIILNISPSTFL